MATWKTLDLQQIQAVSAGAAAVTRAVGAAQTYTLGMSAALTNVAGVVPSLTQLPITLAATAVSQGTSALFSVLDAGGYFCLCYPQDMDFARAQVKDEFLAKFYELRRKYTLSAEQAHASLGLDKFFINEYVQSKFGNLQSPAFNDLESLEKEIANDITRAAQLEHDRYATTFVAIDGTGQASLPVNMPPAAVQAAFRADYEKLIDDLIQLSWKLYYSKFPRRTEFSFNEWVSLISESMNDAGDPRRPQFTPMSVTAGLAVVVGANNVNEFVSNLKRLGEILKNKKLVRMASSASALTNPSTLSPQGRAGFRKFPDWSSASVADVVGMKAERDKIKQRVNAFVQAETNKLASARLVKSIARFNSMTAELTSGMSTLTDLVTTVLNANIGASALYIPPVDGTETINVGGRSVELPRATFGNKGFMDALSGASNAPTWRYTAGFVLMVGAPMVGVLPLLQAAGVTDAGSSLVPLSALLSQYNQLGANIDQIISSINAAANVHSSTLAVFKGMAK